MFPEEDTDYYDCFKPYYNWNTFNTLFSKTSSFCSIIVLNLIITGIPSILRANIIKKRALHVLNLIITGIPSIRDNTVNRLKSFGCFKPYYNWNTFNTVAVLGLGYGIYRF